MPATLSYPGVYIEEIPSGVRTIAGVATSITAFIGRTRRGPVNDPTMVNNFGEFERLFGALSTDYTLGSAVKDFLSNGGSQAIIVRTYKPLFANDAARAAALTQATTDAQAAANAIVQAATDEENNNANATAQDVANAAQAALNSLPANSPAAATAAAQQVANAASIEAAQPPYMDTDERMEIQGATGTTTGDIKLRFSGEATATTIAFSDLTDANAATATDAVKNALDALAAIQAARGVQSVVRSGSSPNFTFLFTFAGPQPLGEISESTLPGGATVKISYPLPDAHSVVQAASNEVNTAVPAAAGAAAPIDRARTSVPNGLQVQAATPGAWGNLLKVEVDYDTKPKDDGSADGTLYNLTITDGVTGKQEKIRNLTNTPNAVRFVGRVLETESSLVRVVGVPTGVRPTATVNPVPADPTAIAADSQALAVDDFVGSLDTKTGMYALEKADLFNLLCIPPDTRAGDTPIAVYQAAMAYCVDKRAMLIVDPPAAWGANQDTATATAIAGLPGLGLNGPQARNAALFFPRIQQSDPMRESQLDIFAPCGAIAGVFARTDATRGVWKAPAGLDAALAGITGLQAKLSDLENGPLNPLAINNLRTFRDAGTVVWGARTLRGANSIGDEYKYIPVRRLALYLEETLYRNTQWVVFEPNDEPLWAQVRLNIGAFMHTLFVQGAFQGKTPRDAYFVKCDKETTTQNDIDRGIVNIVVGFAPLKPAEFVVIKIQQMAGQIQT